MRCHATFNRQSKWWKPSDFSTIPGGENVSNSRSTCRRPSPSSVPDAPRVTRLVRNREWEAIGRAVPTSVPRPSPPGFPFARSEMMRSHALKLKSILRWMGGFTDLKFGFSNDRQNASLIWKSCDNKPYLNSIVGAFRLAMV